MAWVVTASLGRLMADFRTVFPAKSRASDGTIGDTAHQAETSGHNPDDTAGSRAEYTDADSKAEVRAIDVDNTLRDPRGVTMEQVVQRLLATPADRDRLMYVIYNRRIWRKRNSWRQEAYTGSSPHTEHAHFSGDPASDENAAPWTSVLSFQEDGMNDFDPYGKPAGNSREVGVYAADVWGQEYLGTSPYGPGSPSLRTQQLGRLESKLDATLKALGLAQADIDELQARPAYDPAALATALAPLLVGATDEAAVLAVLRSDEGQAALVRAANAAEDS
jgi:hypothetical protein